MKNFLAYIIFNILSFFLSLFTRKISIFFGKLIGTFLYYFIPLRIKVIKLNLKIAFPKLSPQNTKELILQTYQHYGILLTEFLRQKSTIINQKLYSIDDETKRLLENDNNYIFMTAHIGNWEMFIPIISQYKKMLVVIREQANKGGDKFVRYLREFPNITLIPNKGSKRKMLESLKNNESLLLASDQNAKSKGSINKFFGINTSIPKGAGSFFIATQTPIIIGFCILKKNYTYEFKLRELKFKKTFEQKDQLIIEVNTEYSKILEQEIRKYPEQYFWFHKKWDKKIYK